LLIKKRGAKTPIKMKTLYPTVRFALLVVIAILAVLVIHAFASPTARPTATPCPPIHDMKFVVQIRGSGGANTFAELKPGQEHQFGVALGHLKAHGGQFNIHYKSDGNDFPCYQLGDEASIKTDKVIVSEAARKAREGESGDPNAMHRVASNIPADIEDVLKTFQ
jgi:hypothetical protein